MSSPVKRSVTLATLVVILVATLASAQTSSSSSATVTANVASTTPTATPSSCEACKNGSCAKGVKFCRTYTDANSTSASRFCCCGETDMCSGSAMSCSCQVMHTTSNQHHLTPSRCFFIALGAALIAAMLSFTVYYKIKTHRQSSSNDYT